MLRSESGRGLVGTVLAVLVLTALIVVAIAYFAPGGSREIDIADLENAARVVKESTEDASVTAKIKTAFALSKTVSALEIDVDTVDGAVVLRGEVPSVEVSERAKTIAMDVAGVQTVDDQLRVVGARANAPVVRVDVADLELRAAIYERLFRDDDLRGRDFSVAVDNGVVTLSGVVPSESDRARAEAIATGVTGVLAVENRLRVA